MLGNMPSLEYSVVTGIDTFLSILGANIKEVNTFNLITELFYACTCFILTI